jgi:ankyrin repeat domain-containing protein 50
MLWHLLTTVSSSLTIKPLEAVAPGRRMCVAYVYFRYSDRDCVSVRGVLEIFVKQTIERHTECLPLAEEAYTHHLREGTQPTENELLQLLRQFCSAFAETTYVLDAIDEAPAEIRLDLLKKLASLGVRLFITSRPLEVLESQFPNAYAVPIVAQDLDLDLHIAEKRTVPRTFKTCCEDVRPDLGRKLSLL